MTDNTYLVDLTVEIHTTMHAATEADAREQAWQIANDLAPNCECVSVEVVEVLS